MTTDPSRDERSREAPQAREKASEKNVTFVASDGCEVTVTPSGHVFHNIADWY